MSTAETRELIRAHLDACVDIDIPDEEIRRACQPSCDGMPNRNSDARRTVRARRNAKGKVAA